MARKRIGWLVVTLLLALLAFSTGWLLARLRVGSRVDRAALSDLERQFADRLNGVALVGRFTFADRPDRAPNPERYEISSIEKVGGNDWRFHAKFKHGGTEINLPILVPIEWAGDTPMISMTNLSIPGVGAFSVRLLFYGDRYAGTWQNEKTGGHMFGTIEKITGGS